MLFIRLMTVLHLHTPAPRDSPATTVFTIFAVPTVKETRDCGEKTIADRTGRLSYSLDCLQNLFTVITVFLWNYTLQEYAIQLQYEYLHYRKQKSGRFTFRFGKGLTMAYSGLLREPKQRRSVELIDTFCNASMKVLKEEGGQYFSTNLITETSGLVVSSLYRFFLKKMRVCSII